MIYVTFKAFFLLDIEFLSNCIIEFDIFDKKKIVTNGRKKLIKKNKSITKGRE